MNSNIQLRGSFIEEEVSHDQDVNAAKELNFSTDNEGSDDEDKTQIRTSTPMLGLDIPKEQQKPILKFCS